MTRLFIYNVFHNYLSCAVNVLTNSPKTSVLTKRDVFKLNLSRKDDTIEEKFCRADFNSVWDS